MPDDDPTMRLLERSLAQLPEDWELRWHLVTTYQSQGEHERAAALVREAPTAPSDPELLAKAVHVLAARDPIEALGYAESLLCADVTLAGAHLAKAQVCHQIGQASIAARHYRVAVALEPALSLALPHLQDALAPELQHFHRLPPLQLDPPHPAGQPAPPPQEQVAQYLAQIEQAQQAPPPPPATAPPLPPHADPQPAAPQPAALDPAAHRRRERTVAALIAVAAHAAIALIFALIAVSMRPPRTPEIVAVNPATEQSLKPQQRQVAVQTPQRPNAPSAASTQVLTSLATSPVAVPEVPTIDSDLADLGSSFGMGVGFGSGGTGGGVGMPGAMRARCTKSERIKLLSQHGGTIEVEHAVDRSLAWLAARQNNDGSFGNGEHKAAMTGLTLLAFLGRCETPDSTRYGDQVLRGILWLVELGGRQRGWLATNPNSTHSVYDHGIATYALGETYAIARMGERKLPGVREAFEAGVHRIIDGQNPDGGWRYHYRGSGGSDVSVTAWQYQALTAAQHTRLSISGLSSARSKALNYLHSAQDRRSGGFGYTSPSEAASRGKNLTGAGLLGLQLLGSRDRTRMRSAVSFLEARPAPTYEGNCSLYAWYYDTQALFREGGSAWRNWNTAVLPQLLAKQNPDGSWPTEANAGAVNGSSKAGPDAAIYRTALFTLMLEVYYRYLPSVG